MTAGQLLFPGQVAEALFNHEFDIISVRVVCEAVALDLKRPLNITQETMPTCEGTHRSWLPRMTCLERDFE